MRLRNQLDNSRYIPLNNISKNQKNFEKHMKINDLGGSGGRFFDQNLRFGAKLGQDSAKIPPKSKKV